MEGTKFLLWYSNRLRLMEFQCKSIHHVKKRHNNVEIHFSLFVVVASRTVLYQLFNCN